jgi:hypothetical protein
MKQKLKEKISVGDKVKKPSSLQKCLKMSKENENLKNGVLNGDSVITKNHTQQQLKLNNNSNVDRETAKIVGGRLQFYKGELCSSYIFPRIYARKKVLRVVVVVISEEFLIILRSGGSERVRKKIVRIALSLSSFSCLSIRLRCVRINF